MCEVYGRHCRIFCGTLHLEFLIFKALNQVSNQILAILDPIRQRVVEKDLKLHMVILFGSLNS